MASQQTQSSNPIKLFSRLSVVGKVLSKPGRSLKKVRIRLASPIRKFVHRSSMTKSIAQSEPVPTNTRPGLQDACKLHNHKSTIIDKLPYDVLLAILLHMDLEQVQAMSQVCRKLYDATQSPEVWHHLAFDMQIRSRVLVVGDSKNPVTLPLSELKRVVLRSNRLEWNWEKPPRGHHPVGIKQESFGLENITVADLLPIASTYVCDNYLIMPMEDRLVCIDTEAKRWLGQCEMMYIRPRLSFTKSYKKDTIHAVIIGQSPDRTEMEVLVLDIRIDPDAFDITVKYNMAHGISNEWSLVALATNAEENTACLLVYQTRSPTYLQIFLILDWEKCSYCTIDTGLSISKSGDHMTSLIRYSDDNQYIIVCVERDGHWIQESFNVSHFRSHTAHSDTYASLTHPVRIRSHSTPDIADVPYTHTSVPFHIPPDSLGRADQFICWSIPQPHYKYTGVPIQHSHIFVYSLQPADDVINSPTQYQLAQHYTSEGGPYQDGRFIVPLSNSIIMPYDAHLRFPLMGVSFNHIAWIEMVHDDEGGPVETPYPQLRFLTFPDARRPDTPPDIKTLKNVPDDVLELAHQIFIRADMGAIMITTTDNKLHTFYYA